MVQFYTFHGPVSDPSYGTSEKTHRMEFKVEKQFNNALSKEKLRKLFHLLYCTRTQYIRKNC